MYSVDYVGATHAGMKAILMDVSGHIEKIAGRASSQCKN
jgi:hypothetical protein